MKLNQAPKITFNAEKAYKDLFKALVGAMEEMKFDLVKNYMTAISAFGDKWVQGEAKGMKPVIDTVNGIIHEGMEEIVVTVGADHWNAFIMEYGMGSLMDKQNPDLTAYRKYFHSKRPSDGTITTREGGTIHTHPDWDSGSGTVDEEVKGNNPGGINLEQGVQHQFSSGHKYTTKVSPIEPKHILRETIINDQIKKDFQKRITKVFDNFKWQKYLEVW